MVDAMPQTLVKYLAALCAYSVFILWLYSLIVYDTCRLPTEPRSTEVNLPRESNASNTSEDSVVFYDQGYVESSESIVKSTTDEPVIEYEPEITPETVLFEKGVLGYHTARIPALIFHQGVFIAFCEARKDSAADDGNMDILMRRGRRSSMNNVTWDEPRTLVSIARKRVMNPTPIVDRKRGALVLVFISLDPWKTEGFLKRQHRYDEAVYIIKSMDNGLTWSEPVDITSSTLGAMTPIPSMFASGPGHGIQLESGRLIVPGNVYIKHKDAPKNSQSCFDYSMVLYSDDGGDTWTPGGKVPIKTDTQGIMIQTNEAQAVELGSNHVCLNCRTLSELQSRAISCSWDGGITFGLPKLNAKLVEPGFWMRKGSITISGAPGCQGSTIEFPAPPGTKITHLVRKTWALFSNPASMGLRQGESIRISKDGMNSWSEPWTVHRGNSGYSDLTYFETLDNSNIVQNFAVLYEKGADTDSAYHDAIVFKTFTLDDVLENTQL